VADPERLMMRGRLAELADEMKAADARARNACDAIRQPTVLWETADELKIDAIQAAVIDLAEARAGYVRAMVESAKLRERLGL